MGEVKCFFCKREFKDDDEIWVSDGHVEEAVHSECQYDYLLNMHVNNEYTLEELKKELD
ncbi:MAG: hypothetical protein ABTA16_00200 [Niallia sp.]